MSYIYTLISLFFFSATSFAQHNTSTSTKEVCFSDVNKCGLYKITSNGTTVEITVKSQDAQLIGQGTLNEYGGLGIKVNIVSTFEYSIKKATAQAVNGGLSKRTTTLEKEANDLSSISDENWALMSDAAACAGNVLICGGSAFITAETGGLAIFLMRVSCLGAGFSCTSAIRSYQKWSKFQQKKQEQEEKQNPEPENGGNQGGGAGDNSGTGTDAGNTGGGESSGKLPEVGGKNNEVTISEW